MKKAPVPIAQPTTDFKSLFASAPRAARAWNLLTVNDTLSILEDGLPDKPPIHLVDRILHACRKLGNQQSSLRLHAYVVQTGMEIQPPVGNHLVSLLVEVGCVEIAQQLFDKLACKLPSSWNSLISGYLKCGMCNSALDLYQRMQANFAQPSIINFTGLLKACAKLQDLKNGSCLHMHAAQLGLLGKDVFLGSTLVDMYAKCGSMTCAREVFDELPVRGVVAWTSLIAGYVKHGCARQALQCYEQMLLANFPPDVITYTCSLKACSNLGDMEKGLEIHAEMARRELLGKDILVGSSLVDMYISCGLLVQAQEVFDRLSSKDVVSWTAIIAGYTKHGLGERAIEFYEHMQLARIPPNSVTYACTLKACIYAGDLPKALELHEEAFRRGLSNTDQLVGNALIDMYSNFGFLSKAREVLVNLSCRDVISWNSLIAGYVMHGCGREALACYGQMQEEGISCDDVTLVSCLKACASLGAIEEGQTIHVEIARCGYYGSEHVGHVLVDMYAKCGFLVRAEELLNELPYQDVILWNSMMSGQIKHGFFEEGLCSLEQMREESIFPDSITYVCALKACASLGFLEQGERIHNDISKQISLYRDISVCNALVDMYAKCGVLREAQSVFNKLPIQDIIAWTSLISGYAQVGDTEDAIHVFDRMRKQGVEPNLITFVNILMACSHAGLMDGAEAFFHALITQFDLLPAIEHFTCMVNFFGRAGQVEKAVSIISKIPYQPDLLIWHNLLGACQQWGIVEP